MPNKPSAVKALHQNKKQYLYNLRIKRGIKDAIKKARGAFQGDSKKAKELIEAAAKLIDRAAHKGVIKKNNASRRKSRLWAAFHKTRSGRNKAQ